RRFSSVGAGYYNRPIRGVLFLDSRFSGGAAWAVAWSGTGTKELGVGRTMILRAEDESGREQPGAAVRVFDRGGALVFSGTADPGGRVTVPLVTTLYRQAGEDPAAITTSDPGPFSAVLTPRPPGAPRRVPLEPR